MLPMFSVQEKNMFVTVVMGGHWTDCRSFAMRASTDRNTAHLTLI